MSFLRNIEISPYRALDAEDRAWDRNASARDFADDVTQSLARMSDNASDWSARVYRGDFGLPLNAAKREQILEELSVLEARIEEIKGGM